MQTTKTAGLAAGWLLVSWAALADESGPQLEEITVTAQRVAENLQTVPVAITAVSGDFIQKFDLQRVTALDSIAPNLTFMPAPAAAVRR